MDARYCEVMRAALIKDIRPEARPKASALRSIRVTLAQPSWARGAAAP